MIFTYNEVLVGILEMGPPPGLTGSERLAYYKELKKARNRGYQATFQTKQGKTTTKKLSTKPSAISMRNARKREKDEQKKVEDKKERERLRKKEAYWRKKQSIDNMHDETFETSTPKSAFKNKFAKYRAVKRVAKFLPDTPTKRKTSEIILQKIKSCSKTRKNLIQHGVVYSEEKERNHKLKVQ